MISLKGLRHLARYASLNHNIYIAAWTLTMLPMRAIALCAHNVYSANHDDPHTLKLVIYRDGHMALSFRLIDYFKAVLIWLGFLVNIWITPSLSLIYRLHIDSAYRIELDWPHYSDFICFFCQYFIWRTASSNNTFWVLFGFFEWFRSPLFDLIII